MSTQALLLGLGWQIILRSLVAPLFLALFIFLIAGSFAYWQGWLFLALNMGMVLLSLFVLRHNIACALLIWRTAKEDALLQAELPGYKAYASQTRYRLLPGVW